MKSQPKLILTLFFFIACKQNSIQGLPSADSGKIKRSAQFFNDANTSVGQQIGVRSAFINKPGSKIGTSNSQQQNRGTEKVSAIFQNDGRTQVGQQIGPANAFINRPGAQVGNKPNQNSNGSQQSAMNCRQYKKNSPNRQACCNRKKTPQMQINCKNLSNLQPQSQTRPTGQQSAMQNNGQQRTNCEIYNKGSTARQTCCNRKKNPQVRTKCTNKATQSQTSGNRQQGQQSATFNNDGNTQVGQQIGPGASVGSPRRNNNG